MYYLSDICSLCLVAHQNVKSILLPDTDGSVIQEKLRPFLLELIHFRPDIPKYICNNCLLDLNCIYKFRLRWLENTTKLKTYVHKLEVQGSYTNLSETSTDTMYEKQNKSGTYLKKNDMQEKKLHSDVAIKSEFNEYVNSNFMKNDNQITSSKEVKIEIQESKQNFLENNVKEEHENVNSQTPYEIFKEFNDEKDIIGVQASYTNFSETSTDTKYENRNKSRTHLKENDMQEQKLHSDVGIKSEFIEYGNTNFMKNDNQITSLKEVKIEIQEYNQNILEEEHENVNFQTRYEIFKKFNDEKDIIETTVSTHLEDHNYVREAEPFEDKGYDDEYLTSNASSSATSEAGDSDVDKAETQAPQSNETEHTSENLSTMNKNKEFKQFIPRAKYNHAGTKAYKCDVCDKAFSPKIDLIRHKRTHTGERPFKCDVCDKAFSLKCNLITHKRIHTGERPFKCDVCGKAYIRKFELIRHKRTHTGDKPFKCDVCGKAFSYKCALITHKRTHTGEKPFKCDVCGKAFSQKHGVITHKLTHTGEKPFKCDVCGEAFSRKRDFIEHKRIHTGERPFKCDVCGKVFIQKFELIRHKRTHTGERPFKCDVCGKAFIQKFELIRHKRTHTGDKPFKCDVCGKAFIWKHVVIRHKLTHTGEKPFKCDVCGKTFSRKHVLIRHKLTHTGIKSLKCDRLFLKTFFK